MAVNRMSDADFQFLDFQNAEALFSHREQTDALVMAYQMIFGDSNGWAEHYARDEVLSKLRIELSGIARLRLCVRLEPSPIVVGFCWAQVIGVMEILSSIQSIKYFQSIGAPDLSDSLSRLIGDSQVVYVHELGIERAYRGKISLTQLIYPVIQDVSERASAKTVMFWSVPSTHVSKLAKRALFKRGFSVGEMEFYLGQVRRVAALERAHTALSTLRLSSAQSSRHPRG